MNIDVPQRLQVYLSEVSNEVICRWEVSSEEFSSLSWQNGVSGLHDYYSCLIIRLWIVMAEMGTLRQVRDILHPSIIDNAL